MGVKGHRRPRGRWLVAVAIVALLPSAGAVGATSSVALVSAAGVTPAPLDGVPQVLAPVDPATGTGPAAAGLGAALTELLKPGLVGNARGIAVVDVATGALLFGQEGERGITPASTTKVLTAAAVLAALGPDAQLHTRVQRISEGATAGPQTAPPATPAVSPGAPAPPQPPAQIVLVGGGDPLLSSLPAGSPKLPDYPRRASLVDLAGQTAADLTAAGVRQVQLRYDASVFSGPAASPNWERSYTGDVVGPVMGLSADQGRLGPLDGGRLDDPALHTARLFAAELQRRGLHVLGAPTAGIAPAGSETIADVASAPMSAVIEHMLVESDNDVAEALVRQVAIARGKPGTFVDGAAAALAELTALGVDVTGVSLHDGSGLSRDDRIPPQVIAHTLALAAAGPRTELRPLVAGLSIAGVNGTLGQRFTTSSALPARGVLRGKSGYLTGVVALSGVILDASGRMIAFDVAADAVPPGSGIAVRTNWDRVAGVLARCGCA
ncbi:MAG TPA: D-alanyl-D-alanine carboxypeptidase/D-alanyl-D-alanine-endopeptidase [Sporichthya sp.]|nr:D-alanyl-D-alanine carboxypeptidase/D-alanyl-D-alanine-endopeptidase [Sporichthya sp.]